MKLPEEQEQSAIYPSGGCSKMSLGKREFFLRSVGIGYFGGINLIS
jgi:hypothetical protein